MYEFFNGFKFFFFGEMHTDIFIRSTTGFVRGMFHNFISMTLEDE